MEDLSTRISQALTQEEALAERFANKVRLMFISLLTLVELLNMQSISLEANCMNLSALAVCYLYGSVIFLQTRRDGYYRFLKYITSFLDILLVHVLLFMYTMIEIPSVALKNYVFFVVYPLILLTTFRFDRKLTLLTGIWTLMLYLGLFFYLFTSRAITVESRGYIGELFSADVTLIGQTTKIIILICFVALATNLAHYSRRVIEKIVRLEVGSRLEKESLMRELEVASQVQSQLLPRVTPIIQHLKIHGTVLQGRFVGGDYYDFLKISDSSLLVVVADVSGKGVPAALIMSEVRALTHLLASMKLPLDEFIRRLNLFILASTARHYFVSYFIAEIDTSQHVVRYINAGHPPAYVCAQDAMCPLSTRTFVLGSVETLPQLEIQSFPFPVGSMFVAYTDGVFERFNALGEQFGEVRFRKYIQDHQSLDVKSLTNDFFEELNTFGEGKPLDDDATFVAVKWSSDDVVQYEKA